MNIIVNGKAVELEEGSRALEAAKAHSPELYKAALVAHINGERMSLPTVLKEGDVVEILGWEHTYHCYGCDPNNEAGLKMEFF